MEKRELCRLNMSNSLVIKEEFYSRGKRCANFTTLETEILIQLVKQYRDIIECKKTDKVLWRTKNETWEKISIQFNTRSGMHYRDANVLRKKYDNLKKISKKNIAKEDRSGEERPTNHIEDEIRELIRMKTNGVTSQCDTGSSPSQFDSDDVEVTHDVKEPIVFSMFGDWSSYSPGTLRRQRSFPPMPTDLQENVSVKEDPLSLAAGSGVKRCIPPATEASTSGSTGAKPPPCRFRKRGSSLVPNKRWSNLASSQEELVRLQIKCLKEEHAIKMEALRMEHELKMKSLQLDIKIKTKQLEK